MNDNFFKESIESSPSLFEQETLKKKEKKIEKPLKRSKSHTFQNSNIFQNSYAEADDEGEERRLITDFKFETFVRGESNLIAYSACEAVSKNPGSLSNPLFIYGATGLGKTHLLHSVGHKIQEERKNFKVLYITSADFINDVIQGIRFGKMESIRRHYIMCDVLLVDDIQFLENKDTCQLEFFHIFNELYLRSKQIVITSDKFPKDIPNIEERLKSRFMQGLLADVEPPGFEDRVSIIEIKSKFLKLDLSRDLIFLIATHAKTNVREIEGILKTILINHHMTGQAPTLEYVSHLLKRLSKSQTNSLDIQTIQKVVSQHFNIKISELISPSREKKIVVPRHIAMFLSKEMMNLSVVDIAEAFERKDHTTVIHALQKIRKLLEGEREVYAAFSEIKRKLKEMTDN
jgi:chromosomal replication initiator protein